MHKLRLIRIFIIRKTLDIGTQAILILIFLSIFKVYDFHNKTASYYFPRHCSRQKHTIKIKKYVFLLIFFFVTLCSI